MERPPRPCKSNIPEIEDFLESRLWQDFCDELDAGVKRQEEIIVYEATNYEEVVAARAMIRAAAQFKALPRSFILRLEMYAEELKRQQEEEDEDEYPGQDPG